MALPMVMMMASSMGRCSHEHMWIRPDTGFRFWAAALYFALNPRICHYSVRALLGLHVLRTWRLSRG